jgi:hypothetical protein
MVGDRIAAGLPGVKYRKPGASSHPMTDALYHRLFSHPLMVEQLIRDFIPDAILAGIDFRTGRAAEPGNAAVPAGAPP